MILPKVRDPRFITIRRGGTLSDDHHRLLALWAAACAEHVLRVGIFSSRVGSFDELEYDETSGSWTVTFSPRN